MDSWIRFLSYINLAGSIHALIQSMVLGFTRRGNRRANQFMAAFLVAMAIGMANGMISLLGLYDIWPVLAIVMGSVVLAYHPLFYLYIRAMTDKDRRGTVLDVLHGFPLLLGMLDWGVYLSISHSGIVLSGPIGFVVRSPWFFTLIMVVLQSIVYIPSIIHLLRQHSARIKTAYSTLDQVSLGWLHRRLVVYIAIWAVALLLIAVVKFEKERSFWSAKSLPFSPP